MRELAVACRMRLERIQRLKRGLAVLPDTKELFQSEADAPQMEAALVEQPAKRRRTEPAGEGREAPSGSEGDASDEEELDWRAKGL